MKIVIIIPRLSDASPIRVAISHAKAFLSKGLSVKVLVLFGCTGVVDGLRLEKFQLRALSSADVVFTHCIQPNVLLAIIKYFGVLKRAQLVTMLHTDVYRDLVEKPAVIKYFSERIWAWSIKRHSVIYYLNGEAARYFMDNQSRMVKIANGIDLRPVPIVGSFRDALYEKFLDLNQGSIKLCTWCVLRVVKNISWLIDFIESRPAYSLVIVGSGPEIDDLQDRVINAELQDRVFFSGYSPCPYEYAIRSDVAVFPSLSEGFPVAVLEAFKWGVPVAVSKIQSFNENFESEVEFFDLGNPNELDAAVSKLLFRPESYVELARQSLESKYNYSVIADEMLRDMY